MRHISESVSKVDEKICPGESLELFLKTNLMYSTVPSMPKNKIGQIVYVLSNLLSGLKRLTIM